MRWGKTWRLSVLALVTAALAALAVAPMPGVDIVVVLPGRGQAPDPQDLLQSLGLAILGLAVLVAPPAFLVWMSVHVLRYGRFFGKQPREIAPPPH
jgi:hypothetical protein